MKKYDVIFEQLQEKVNSGELTMEDAQVLNDVAFEKYGDDETEYEEVTESSDDEGVTYEEYLESMEEELFGEATRLSKELHKKQLKTSDEYRRYVDAYNKYKEKAKNEKNPEVKKTFKTIAEKYKKKADIYKHNKEYYKHVDTIHSGKMASKMINAEDEFADYKVPKHLAQRLQRKEIRNGKVAKFKQHLDFNTLPSKKSLENRPAGRFV